MRVTKERDGKKGIIMRWVSNRRLPWWLSGKESACQYRRCGFDPWVGKIPWIRNGKSFQYSCLGNPRHRRAWWATVHEVMKNQT